MRLKEKMIYRNNSLYWANNEIEIAKYLPSKYNASGIYTDDNEWTEYFDVGNGVSLRDYLQMEMRYIQTACRIFSITQCSFITLVNYENLSGNLLGVTARTASIKLNNNRQFLLSDEDIRLLLLSREINEGSRISTNNVNDLLKLLLRGFVNADVCNEAHKVYLRFPGSYYMWLKCPAQYHKIVINVVKEYNLYYNPRNSMEIDQTINIPTTKK